MRSRKPWVAGALFAAAICARLPAQINALSSVLSVTPPQNIIAKRNQTVRVDLRIDLRNGYHVNSDKPADPYLKPLGITWLPGPIAPQQVRFPAPRMQKFDFSQQPLSVFEGTFKVSTDVKVRPDAPFGPAKLAGKLRYQACNQRECLPPRTLDVSVPFEIRR